MNDVCVCGGQARVLGCPVPVFYYRKKPWKPRILSETMEAALRPGEGLTDTVLHPQIAAMLTEEYVGKWQSKESTEAFLLRYLTGLYAAGAIEGCGEAAVLLGGRADMARQMETAWELLQPFLPKINRLVIFGEEAEDGIMREALEDYLDDYYYEYGLVPQTESYEKAENGLRCGRTRCRGLILDYSADFRYPRLAPDGEAVYIDAASAGDKEARLHRKTPQIPYVSPLKYLDTMVKNSYDRLVN